MANPFVHVELQTTDVGKAKAFYSKLFDWKLEDAPLPPGSGGQGSYTIIKVGEGTGGGIMSTPAPGAPSQWLAYVSVEDVAAATRKARDLGARVLMDTTKVPDMGTMSVLVDPTGATFALWQAVKK